MPTVPCLFGLNEIPTFRVLDELFRIEKSLVIASWVRDWGLGTQNCWLPWSQVMSYNLMGWSSFNANPWKAECDWHRRNVLNVQRLCIAAQLEDACWITILDLERVWISLKKSVFSFFIDHPYQPLLTNMINRYYLPTIMSLYYWPLTIINHYH